MSLFGQTLVLYLVIGIGVAGAVYLAGGTGRWFRVATAVPFWPLYLPLLLAPGRAGASGPTARPTAPHDELAAAIGQVDAELESALGSLDGWAEADRHGGRDALRAFRVEVPAEPLEMTADQHDVTLHTLLGEQGWRGQRGQRGQRGRCRCRRRRREKGATMRVELSETG